MRFNFFKLLKSVLSKELIQEPKVIQEPEGDITELDVEDVGTIKIIKSRIDNSMYLKFRFKINSATKYDYLEVQYIEETVLDMLYPLLKDISYLIHEHNWYDKVKDKLLLALKPTIVKELEIYGNTRKSKVYFVRANSYDWQDDRVNLLVLKEELIELGAMNCIISKSDEYKQLYGLEHLYDKLPNRMFTILDLRTTYKEYVQAELEYISKSRCFRQGEEEFYLDYYFEVSKTPKPLTDHLIFGATRPTNINSLYMREKYENFFKPYNRGIRQIENGIWISSFTDRRELDSLFDLNNVNLRIILGKAKNRYWEYDYKLNKK